MASVMVMVCGRRRFGDGLRTGTHPDDIDAPATNCLLSVQCVFVRSFVR